MYKQNYNKWQSRRYIITVWIMVLLTLVVLGCFLRNEYQMISVVPVLSATPAAYVTMETFNKKWRRENGYEVESGDESEGGKQ